MGIWIIRAVAVTSLMVVAGVALIETARGWPGGPLQILATSVNAGAAVTFLFIGWLISERKQSNAIGPLLLILGATFAWFAPIDMYLNLPEVLRQRPAPRLPAQLAAVWVAIGTVVPAIISYVILILFPDGRPPSRRWRWVIVFAMIGAVCGVAGIILDPGPLPNRADYTSPWGIAGFSGQPLIVASEAVTNVLRIVAAAALAVRWHRGDRVERAQLKWVVTTALVFVALSIAATSYDDATVDQFSWFVGVAINISLALIAVAIGVAILRFHLYAIDRIVSRTIAYGVVIGALAILFYAIVIGLSSVLVSFAQGESIAVAASTLVVFAAFQPVARRVHGWVDLRFNRAHYDAQQTAVAFSIRLRDEVDLEIVAGDLDATVRQAVDPTTSGLWIRTKGRSSP